MLTIKSGLKNYDVNFIDHLDEVAEHLCGMTNAVVVIDKNIAQLYPALKEKLDHVLPVIIVEATEENKTLAGAEAVLSFLQQHKASKNTKVIAIGGGITQDIASFVAHIYYRGVPFVFVPTTLLAMSDSCIGAKCGLNYNGYKNQIGAFHSPDEVIICTAFLDTLTDLEIYSGYGEILKLMLIDSKDKYTELAKTIIAEGFRNSKTKTYILESLKIKKGYIEEDEFDTGIRRILNYGHSFGHALELATNYAIPHGVAVARGMDLVNFIAYNMGFLGKEDYLQVHDFIVGYFHCGFCPKISAADLISYAKLDKKINNSMLNLILLEQPGQLKIVPTKLDNELQSMVHSYLESNNHNLYLI